MHFYYCLLLIIFKLVALFLYREYDVRPARVVDLQDREEGGTDGNISYICIWSFYMMNCWENRYKFDYSLTSCDKPLKFNLFWQWNIPGNWILVFYFATNLRNCLIFKKHDLKGHTEGLQIYITVGHKTVKS